MMREITNDKHAREVGDSTKKKKQAGNAKAYHNQHLFELT